MQQFTLRLQDRAKKSFQAILKEQMTSVSQMTIGSDFHVDDAATENAHLLTLVMVTWTVRSVAPR